MEHRFLEKAFEWVQHPTGTGILNEEERCPTRDIFQVRLDRAFVELQKQNFSDTALCIAVIGEIGNNVYDHNFGNWRDMPGAYFALDSKEKVAVIADRGQGVWKTLARIEPNLADDTEAIRVAFTKQISGRSPERRGNGLKFVKAVVEQKKWNLEFYSGTGEARMRKGNQIEFHKGARNIKGCIVFVSV